MKHLHQSAIAFFTLLILALLGIVPANLGAATNTVTSTADNGVGTLRQALASVANEDTINFSLPLPATITLTSGELLVTNSVTIAGPGATNLAVDGNAASRVFHIMSNNVVTIASLTITNGHNSDRGGGIFNDHATLTLRNCRLIGNSAGDGGGIYNDGFNSCTSLKITDSTLSRNSAGYDGGGIYNIGYIGSANLEITDSTLSGNSAFNDGGGIFNQSNGNGYGNGGSTSLEITDSTLSGNSAGDIGGGIFNGSQYIGGSASLTVSNSTLSGNLAYFCGNGGNVLNYAAPYSGSSASGKIINSTLSSGNSVFGIENLGSLGSDASLQIGSSIMNVNDSGLDISIFNYEGNVTSLGYNLSSDDGGGFLTNATDQINTDPKLGPLQDNGGPTFTHAFICRSPAIDRGFNFSASTTDQRGVGFIRTFDDPAAPDAAGGDGTDIGAFEAQQPLPVCDNPPVADASATVQLIISANNTNATVILDGTRSSDPDGDPLQYNWYEAGNPLATGVVAVTILPVGTPTLSLVVSDGLLTATNDIPIEVITAAEAVNRLTAMLGSNVNSSQPLVASLRAALASIDRNNPTATINQLVAFQNKVHAQVEPLDATLAASLIQSAQDVIDGLSAGNTGKSHGHFTSLVRKANGHVQLQFTAETAGTFILEASTDLVNWEMIGVAVPMADSQYQFEDTKGSKFSRRFYRLVQP